MPHSVMKIWNLALGRPQNLRASYNAAKTITTEHERIHAGKMWHHADVSTLAAGATINTLIAVSSNSELHLRSIGFDANVGPCEGYFYEAPVIDVNSLGTGFIPKNLNRRSSNLSVSSFYIDPVIDVNSLGDRIDVVAIVAATGGPIKSISGESASAVTEWILKPGNKYLFRFTNKNGSTGLYNSNITFYEPLDT